MTVDIPSMSRSSSPPSPSPSPWRSSSIGFLPSSVSSQLDLLATTRSYLPIQADAPGPSSLRSTSDKLVLGSLVNLPKKTPSKRRSRAASSVKKFNSTSSVMMDSVINCRAASSQDSIDLVPYPTKTKVSTPRRRRTLAPLSSSSASASTSASASASTASTSTSTMSSLPEIAQQDLNKVRVLQTPRRGRRLGGVDMGWQSPETNSSSSSLSTSKSAQPICPHTIPKASRFKNLPDKQILSRLPATPTKSKPNHLLYKDHNDSHRSLVDTQGWASAAMVSSVPLAKDQSNGSPGFSPRPIIAPKPASPKHETKHPIASFSPRPSPVAPHSPKLVPVQIQGFGRLILHRQLAEQLNDNLPSTSVQHQQPQRHLSFSSDFNPGMLSSSDTDASSSASSLGASTNPTSIGTPCPSTTSPTFSPTLRFAGLEPESPRSKMGLPNCIATSASVQSVLRQQPVQPLTMLKSQSTSQIVEKQRHGQELSTWCPRLGGSKSFTSQLPILDWPDDPSGPWAAAGEQIDHIRQTRKQGIQKWLQDDPDPENDNGNPTENNSHGYHHHPMVAKALLDRARRLKQAATLNKSAKKPSQSASSSRKRTKRATKTLSALQHPLTTPKKRGRKPKVPDSASSRFSVATSFSSLARSSRDTPLIGCKCGVNDESIIMVQCDACLRWLHLPCVGISNVDELDDEWFCDDCAQPALTQILSPAMTVQTLTSLASMSTPAASHSSSHQPVTEPVFALPSGTPVHRHGISLSSSIALAPSPPMFSVGEYRHTRSSGKRQGEGRSRAERVGWRINEPGSPLARKSTTASGIHRPTAPVTPTKSSSESTLDLNEATSTPNLLAGFLRTDWEPTHSSRRDPHHTPSPKLAVIITPSRHASGPRLGRLGGGGGGGSTTTTTAAAAAAALSLGLGPEDVPSSAADVFSTPSRLSSSGPWGYRSLTGNQTPSRSEGRQHPQRMDSLSTVGVNTPSRDFLSSAFGTEHSTGMPSLVFSSGGLDVTETHPHHRLGDSVGGGYMSNSASSARIWQLQSPTSSTRAATRARQVSASTPPPTHTSHLLKTPELQSCKRSIRTSYNNHDQLIDTEDPPTSSSPFPRTPTFDLNSPRFLNRQRNNTATTSTSTLGLGFPLTSSPSPSRLTKTSSSSSLSSKSRQISGDLSFGLGIGIDLDDVLDWS